MEVKTDEQKQEMVDEYNKALLGLRRKGLAKLIDGGKCVQITEFGKVVFWSSMSDEWIRDWRNVYVPD